MTLRQKRYPQEGLQMVALVWIPPCKSLQGDILFWRAQTIICSTTLKIYGWLMAWPNMKQSTLL